LEENQPQNESNSRKINQLMEQNLTQFGQKLWDSRTDLRNLDSIVELIGLLMDLGPSAIDLEVLALSPEGGGSLELM
jgi:hypothetical protein